MIKELKSFSPCEIMSCSRQHHKMSPDTPRPQRAAPHCGPEQGKGVRAVRPGLLSWPDGAGRAGPEQCGRPGEQQCRCRAALDFYRGLGGGKEGFKRSRALARAPTVRCEPKASREALASWPHVLQVPASWSRGPVQGARGG